MNKDKKVAASASSDQAHNEKKASVKGIGPSAKIIKHPSRLVAVPIRPACANGACGLRPPGRMVCANGVCRMMPPPMLVPMMCPGGNCGMMPMPMMMGPRCPNGNCLVKAPCPNGVCPNMFS